MPGPATSFVMMEILGYLAALAIGLTLGLIGGGGSILTVPVLVYLFGIDPVLATAYSLFIVGVTSLAGIWPKYRDGMVDIKTGLIFGLPSIVSVYATRMWIIPAIPDELYKQDGVVLTKSVMLMLLFALLMTIASISMIRSGNGATEKSGERERTFNYPLIMLEGLVVGMLTGLVGAGGGFLIIPALVLLSGLPMKKAIGTSLMIIAMKSLVGFLGDLSHSKMQWPLLFSITAMALIGLFIGNAFNRKVNAAALKKGFGWFVLVMGVYIVLKELLG